MRYELFECVTSFSDTCRHIHKYLFIYKLLKYIKYTFTAFVFLVKLFLIINA